MYNLGGKTSKQVSFHREIDYEHKSSLSQGLFTQDLEALGLSWCSSQAFRGLCCLSSWPAITRVLLVPGPDVRSLKYRTERDPPMGPSVSDTQNVQPSQSWLRCLLPSESKYQMTQS